MQPITFASRGRLDTEKGRARLLPALRSLCESSDTPPFVVHIYGDGEHKDEVVDLAARYPHQIFYHGRQSLKTIQKQLKHTDYALMPSLFLETFGLTALESLAQGVPVIGYRQGGLEPFILNGLDLFKYDTIFEQLQHLIKDHHLLNQTALREESLSIASRYTSDAFIKNITDLHHGHLPQKIVLVSDYINLLGGIETYLYKLKDLLESHGCEVHIVGGQREKNATRKKYLQLAGTVRNPLLRKKITQAIHTHEPDLVRYHSVLRNIGHAGIVRNPYGEARVTYHDLGLMHPFPSHVHHTNQVKPGLLGRLRESPRYMRPLTTLKYLSTLLIRKKLTRHYSQHIVPSPFLVPMISRTQKEKVTTIGHFID